MAAAAGASAQAWLNMALGRPRPASYLEKRHRLVRAGFRCPVAQGRGGAALQHGAVAGALAHRRFNACVSRLVDPGLPAGALTTATATAVVTGMASTRPMEPTRMRTTSSASSALVSAFSSGCSYRTP